MRWIKHPSAFSRSAAMTDVREVLGPAGYGAVWLLLERIAENWDGKTAPDLRLSIKEWRKTCELSAKKLQSLLEILENYEIIFVKKDANKLCLEAPILLELLDEWTSRNRKNSGVAPEPLASNSGIQTEQETDIDKDKNKTHPPSANLRSQLAPVLKRHGIDPGSERGRRLIRYVEQKQPENPGGYLQTILREKPYFDPVPVGAPESPISGGGTDGPAAVADVLRGMRFMKKKQ